MGAPSLPAEGPASWVTHLPSQGQGPGCGKPPADPGSSPGGEGLGPDGEELQSRTPAITAVRPLGTCGNKEPSLGHSIGRETEAQREPRPIPCWVVLLSDVPQHPAPGHRLP